MQVAEADTDFSVLSVVNQGFPGSTKRFTFRFKWFVVPTTAASRNSESVSVSGEIGAVAKRLGVAEEDAHGRGRCQRGGSGWGEYNIEIGGEDVEVGRVHDAVVVEIALTEGDAGAAVVGRKDVEVRGVHSAIAVGISAEKKKSNSDDSSVVLPNESSRPACSVAV